MRPQRLHHHASGTRGSGGSASVKITAYYSPRRAGARCASTSFVFSLCHTSSLFRTCCVEHLDSSILFLIASQCSVLQITFNYGGSEVDLQAAANNRGPTILGKRSAAPTEESSEKSCPKFDETQVRKPCLCGAARCCGYLPFT